MKGGAMDLAIGAEQTWGLLTKQGASKLVERCADPLTGLACVKRDYTDLATFVCTPGGLQLLDAVDGISREDLQSLIGLPIALPTGR